MNKSGKRSIVFNRSKGLKDFPVDVPCGRCIGCRLEYARQWAIRCIHEASEYDDNIFVTLTYNDENLPPGGSLRKADFTKFMKRLRQQFPDRKIRYFQCGEYGEACKSCGLSRNDCLSSGCGRFVPGLGRPHHHALFFNFDLPDKCLLKIENGYRLYTSQIMDDTWSHGHCFIGTVTYESAGYVARYVTKKITGEKAEAHYNGRVTEYVTSSRRPGIASTWYEKWKNEVFPDDFIIINGKKVPVPKFYRNKLENDDEWCAHQLRLIRLMRLKKHADDNTIHRLRVRETVKHAQIKSLDRS